MFDTGGVSIKGSTNMHYMKCDMGGGAIALGSVLLAAELNLPVKVTAVVPAVMNMLDGSAYVPGDVLTAYNGLSIEVIDTDAEGRLVLADALAFAALDLKPDILLDFATLTGAAVTALGYHSSALMTKNEHLQEQLIQAGNKSGDRVWPLPLWDEYGEPLASDIADVKNYAGPASGVIFAGKFLEKFTEEHPAWAHLDVAGMVLQQGPFGKDRVATGYGIELVAEFLKSLESPL
jgi:leucyl aminopeptidase